MSSFERNVNIYNEQGRLLQLEYAMKAMTLGTTTIGTCSKDAVILISEKKITSRHQNLESAGKSEKLFDHIGFSFSGISGDAKKIMQVARRICLQHMKLHEENIGVEGLLKDLCHLSLQFSESDEMKKILSRPFGASVMLGVFEETPKLFVLDPSGTYRRFGSKAIGSACETLEEDVLKELNEEISTEESIKRSIKILGSVMQEKINSKNIEIMRITKDQVYSLTESEISAFL